MNIIEGGFGKKGKSEGTAEEFIIEAISDLGLSEESDDCDFILAVKTERGFRLVGTENIGELMVLLESAKMSLLDVYTGTYE